MLTNQKNGDFTITELEIWSIKEVVRNNKILIYIERMKTLRETERITENEYQRQKRKRERNSKERAQRQRQSQYI